MSCPALFNLKSGWEELYSVYNREWYQIWLNKRFNLNYLKSFKKIRYRQNCFLIRTILIVKHDNKELISNNTDIFRELPAISTTHFSKIYIISSNTNIQRAPSKLNCSKNFVQNSYHIILTLSESYYQTILTCSELISDSINTFRVITKQ